MGGRDAQAIAVLVVGVGGLLVGVLCDVCQAAVLAVSSPRSLYRLERDVAQNDVGALNQERSVRGSSHSEAKRLSLSTCRAIARALRVLEPNLRLNESAA